MKKKVLILSGTPRKGGNSDLLCDAFMNGAKDAGHNVEKISLRDKKISFCTGCAACYESGICVIKDDMKDILQKMVDADVIVMATPVYFYTLCGQMKTLIDRTVARYAEIKNKHFYYIVTAADTSKANLERTVECFRGFADDCLEGAVEKGVLYGAAAWEKGKVVNLPVMQEAYQMGKSV